MINISIGISPIVFIVPSLILLAVRSTKGIERLSSSERAKIELPDEVKDILVGILLGALFCFTVVRILALYLYFVFSLNLYMFRFAVNFKSLDVAVVYNNPKAEKALILKENKGKSGIYL